jgi:hypothetical protein
MKTKHQEETALMIAELLNRVKLHDYSYQFSDDFRYWLSGSNSEKKILEMIKSLKCRYQIEELLPLCLNQVEEQYKDGLTHKTIKKWFSDECNS